LEERLLEATRKLLADGATFTEVSVEQLIAEAGIARSTFYRYFQDKADLIRALTEASMGELWAALRPWLDRGQDASPQDIRAAVVDMLRHFREHDVLLQAVVDTASYDPDVRDLYRKLVDTHIRALTRVIRDAQEAGAGPAAPARETAELLSWMVERSCYQMVRGANDDALARIADATATIIWSTLHAPAPQA
jgi:TetR/AcrR family transcriptional regulator, ethionamide resistance regulator